MITAFLIRKRDQAGDVWVYEVARVPLHRDRRQEARARRAERRLTAWDNLLTAWTHLTRLNR